MEDTSNVRSAPQKFAEAVERQFVIFLTFFLLGAFVLPMLMGVGLNVIDVDSFYQSLFNKDTSAHILVLILVPYFVYLLARFVAYVRKSKQKIDSNMRDKKASKDLKKYYKEELKKHINDSGKAAEQDMFKR